MRAATAADVLTERIARHGFIDRPASSVADTARRSAGLQAQDPQASRLGVRSRAQRVTEADVLRAIEVERSVVRTWLMRATIHLVAADDVVWMARLFGPANARKFRARWRDLGLTDDLLAHAVTALPEVLTGGPRTRLEIVAALGERGIPVDPSGQAPTHLLLHATTLGLVCRGPERGRDNTFALVAEWVPAAPDGPSGDDALAELARRFFAAFSPATAADFSTWSGLPSGRALALIRDELTPLDLGGHAGYTFGEVAPQHGLRLLPAFDNYLVGYRERELIIDAVHRPQVYVGGVIQPTVLHEGRVIGTWRLARKAGSAAVQVTPFGNLTRMVRAAIEAEAADIGRFIGLPATLAIAPPPT